MSQNSSTMSFMRYIALCLTIFWLSYEACAQSVTIYEFGTMPHVIRGTNQLPVEVATPLENYDYVEVSDSLVLINDIGNMLYFTRGAQFFVWHNTERVHIVLLSGTMRGVLGETLGVVLYDGRLHGNNANVLVGVGIEAAVVLTDLGEVRYVRSNREHGIAAGSGLSIPLETALAPERFVLSEGGIEEAFDTWLQKASYFPTEDVLVRHYQAGRTRLNAALEPLHGFENELNLLLDAYQTRIVLRYPESYSTISRTIIEREEHILTALCAFIYADIALQLFFNTQRRDRVLIRPIIPALWDHQKVDEKQLFTLLNVFAAAHMVQNNIPKTPPLEEDL